MANPQFDRYKKILSDIGKGLTQPAVKKAVKRFDTALSDSFKKTFIPSSKEFQSSNRQFSKQLENYPDTAQAFEGARRGIIGMDKIYREPLAPEPTDFKQRVIRGGSGFASSMAQLGPIYAGGAKLAAGIPVVGKAAQTLSKVPVAGRLLGKATPYIASDIPVDTVTSSLRGENPLAGVALGAGLNVGLAAIPGAGAIDPNVSALKGSGIFETREFKNLERYIPKLKEVMQFSDEADDKAMKNLIDYVRIKKAGGKSIRPDSGEAIQIEIAARRFAKAIGLNPDVPNGSLSRTFDKVLKQKNEFLKKRGAGTLKRHGLGFVGDNKSTGNKAENMLESAYKEVQGGASTKTPLKDRLRQGWDEFYTQTVNQFNPVEKAVKNVEKSKGFKVRPEHDPLIAYKRLLGAGGAAELRHKSSLKPILDELKASNIANIDMDVYLKAQRDIELSGRGVFGSNLNVAKARVEELGNKYDISVLESAAKKLYKYQDEGLQALRDSGFIDDAGYKTIRGANKSYVPFNRVIDELDNYLGLPSSTGQQASQPIKKIKGSERPIYSPLESVVANTYKIESAVSKNRVASQIANLRKIDKSFAEMIRPVKKSGDNVLSVWENGAKQYYEVPEDIARAVKGLDLEQSNIITQILSAPARVLRQQATGRNLEFMIPNVFRDQLDAAMNSKYGYRPFIDYFDGLRHMINYSKTGSDDIVEGWINAGGQMSFESMAGRKSVSKQISDSEKKSIIKKVYEWTTGGIETVGKYSENPTRIGLYKRALKATDNSLISMRESRESTLDFGRIGSKMKVANSIIPFLNVGVQGFDRMIRTIKDNPKKATTLLAIYGGLPAATTTIYNVTQHKDAYSQVPDFEKDSNFIIMTGKSNEDGSPIYIKIPKGHMAELVANPTMRLIEYYAGANPQSFGQFATQFLSSGLPVLGEGGTIPEVASRTLGNVMPQAIKPAAEATANFSFFKNRPIVPFYQENKPPAEQFNKYTPGVYVKAGKILGASPLKIKNVVEGYLAGGVKQPENLFKTLSAISEGKAPRPDDAFIARRFLGSYSGFDTDRPENEESGIDLKAIAAPIAKAAASDGGLPENKEQLLELYKDAQRKRDSYAKNKAKSQAGIVQKPLGEYQGELDQANAIVRQIEKQHPEIIYETLKSHYKIDKLLAMQNDGAIDRYEKVNKSFDVGRDIIGDMKSGELDEATATKLISDMGISVDDVAYFDIASAENAAKTKFVIESLGTVLKDGSTGDDLLIFLGQMRREVNGKMILANGVIDDLYKGDIITSQEKAFLKGLKLDEKGKQTSRSRSGSSKKVKIIEPKKIPRLDPSIYDVRPKNVRDYTRNALSLDEFKVPSRTKVNLLSSL